MSAGRTGEQIVELINLLGPGLILWIVLGIVLGVIASMLSGMRNARDDVEEIAANLGEDEAAARELTAKNERSEDMQPRDLPGGCLSDIVIGVAGALIGGGLVGKLALHGFYGLNQWSILASVLGSVLLLLFSHAIQGR
jgi:uncharacterized membrane protein YeaQ/YmgE (transglycosylase-associated protein family)